MSQRSFKVFVDKVTKGYGPGRVAVYALLRFSRSNKLKRQCEGDFASNVRTQSRLWFLHDIAIG